MWHSRFFGTILTVLALLGFVERASLAAYPTPSKFSMNQETQGLDGSFQLAIMGSSAVPLDIPLELSSEKVQPEKPAVKKPIAVMKDKADPLEQSPEKVQPEKPAVEKPKAIQKASKPKKKKVKKANVKKAPAKKPVEEEEGFLSKTFKQLVGGDDDKKEAAAKSQLQKMAGKKPEPEKKEEGLLTKTLKTLVGGDKKEEQTAKKNTLNPINMAPAGNATNQKKEEKQAKTAISETKKTLKDSFEKLIGVGAVKEDGDSQSAKQAKAEKTVKKKSAPAKPKRITARKYIEEEEAQLEKDRGGVKKGKNVLKESFKTLVIDEKKKKKEEGKE